MKSFKQYITELFDNPANFDKTVDDSLFFRNYNYTAQISGKELEFTAKEEKVGYWIVSFSFDNEKNKVYSKGKEVEIFSTVIAMFKDFIKDVNPTDISFAAKTEEQSRVSLYDRMIRILGKKYGYKLVDTRSVMGHMYYHLSK